MRQRLLTIIAVVLLTSVVAMAHGDAEHVQGTVTSVSATSITVQTPAKATRTIKMNAKTMVMRGKTHLGISDIKVGDRVVLDVDKEEGLVSEVKLGATSTAATAERKDHKN